MRGDKEERLRAVLAGQVPDRPPVVLWRHWPDADQSGDRLARATVEFQQRHDFDFVKLCPASNFAVEGWGGHSVCGESPVGTRDWIDRAVNEPEDWSRLRPLDPRVGLQGEMLTALRLVRAELGGGVPIIPTVFSPLAMAKYLAGEEALLRHLRTAPDAVLAGLRTIAESTICFLEEAQRVGIDGIFFAVQHASHALLTEEEYRCFGEPWDRRVLSVVSDCWLNVLHLHGSEPMFALGADYPVAAINWHAEETSPSLIEAASMTDKTLCGGLGSAFPLVGGTPEEVRAAVHRACVDVGPLRLIVSGGCVLPLAAEEANIAAVRAAVDEVPV